MSKFRQLTLYAVFCLAAGTAAMSAPAPVTGAATVTIAQGAPFSFVRGTALYSGGKGSVLKPGDILESKADSLLILEIRSGTTVCTVIGIGPATRAYWMDRTEPTLALLGGWVKVDARASNQCTAFKVQGTRLGASSNAGTYIVHAADAGDEAFHESGAMTLWALKADGSATSQTSLAGEFASRMGSGDVQKQPRPAAAFSSALPAAFRDALPSEVSARPVAVAEPKLLHDVLYEDVGDWLAAPRDWRKGFLTRFRPRLKDPVFFKALDAQMSSHPEWEPILHPPPPPPPPEPKQPVPAPPPPPVNSAPDEPASGAGPSITPPKTSGPAPGPAVEDGAPSAVGQHVGPALPTAESETSMSSCPYPEQALHQGQSSAVGLLVNITAEGLVINARVIESSGNNGLDQAAVSCVLAKARFPAKRLTPPAKSYMGHMNFNWSRG